MATRLASSRSRSTRASGSRRSKTLRVSRPRTPTAARSRTRATARRAARPTTVQINRTAKVTIDHHEIRRWAEARDGIPAVVKRTFRPEEAEGILRIDFPGFTGEGTLEHVSWDEWFKIFDKHKLAFLFQERKANGELSTFNKLVRRSELL